MFFVACTALLLAAAAENGPPAEVLAQAQSLYKSLDYDRVAPLAEAVLGDVRATPDQRLDAYVLRASCAAILGQTAEAERSFRLLLRGRPEFDLPSETPPKILGIFRRVQSEEKEIISQTRELERRRLMKEIVLSGGPPRGPVRGGLPLAIEYRVTDPRGLVQSVSFRYRKIGSPSYSSLALSGNTSGVWQAVLPAEWTASDGGFVLEYHVTALDGRGDKLASLGSESEPSALTIESGEVGDAEPFYASVWFWSLVGVVAVGATVTSVVVARQGAALPPSDLGEIPYR